MRKRKLAIPLSGYTRLINRTKSGDVVHIFIKPVQGIYEGRKLKQKTVTAGYWIRKDTSAGPTLYGPVALYVENRKVPVASPTPIYTWRRFWSVAGMNITPVIAKYKRIDEPRRTYIEQLYRQKIRMGMAAPVVA